MWVRKAGLRYVFCSCSVGNDAFRRIVCITSVEDSGAMSTLVTRWQTLPLAFHTYPLGSENKFPSKSLMGGHSPELELGVCTVCVAGPGPGVRSWVGVQS